MADLKYLCALARLSLSDDEAERLEGDINGVLDYVGQIAGAETDGIEPTAHASPVVNVFREDIPSEAFDASLILANAPGLIDGKLFKVPQVMPGTEETP